MNPQVLPPKQTIPLTSAQLRAQMMRDQVVPGAEKCGGNEAHVLADGRLGKLAHTAYDAADGQHYFATAFVLDPVTLEFTPMQMVASREVFAAGPAKRSSLSDVVFSGGLVRHGGTPPINRRCGSPRR